MESKLGKSGHIVDMVSAVLGVDKKDMSIYLTSGYCARNLGDDYLEWDCENCSLVNYGMDCRNNPIWYS